VDVDESLPSRTPRPVCALDGSGRSHPVGLCDG
jgi:hypothetical protein